MSTPALLLITDQYLTSIMMATSNGEPSFIIKVIADEIKKGNIDRSTMSDSLSANGSTSLWCIQDVNICTNEMMAEIREKYGCVWDYNLNLVNNNISIYSDECLENGYDNSKPIDPRCGLNLFPSPNKESEYNLLTSTMRRITQAGFNINGENRIKSSPFKVVPLQ